LENNQEEIWKDVPGYEGMYQVSNLGRVKSLKRIVERSSWRKTLGVREKILYTYQNKKGYLSTGLSKNNKKRVCLVHRLVAIAFIPNPDNKPEVNHKNLIKDCNVVSNLEWCTALENSRHVRSLKEIRPSRYWKGKLGKDHNCSKPVVQISKSGDIVATYGSAKEASRITNINSAHIGLVCNGNTVRKSAGGFKWRFANV
jgi:hypothetical protein